MVILKTLKDIDLNPVVPVINGVRQILKEEALKWYWDIEESQPYTDSELTPDEAVQMWIRVMFNITDKEVNNGKR